MTKWFFAIFDDVPFDVLTSSRFRSRQRFKIGWDHLIANIGGFTRVENPKGRRITWCVSQKYWRGVHGIVKNMVGTHPFCVLFIAFLLILFLNNFLSCTFYSRLNSTRCAFMITKLDLSRIFIGYLKKNILTFKNYYCELYYWYLILCVCYPINHWNNYKIW